MTRPGWAVSVRPSRIDTLYVVANAYAERSTCNRLAVGAVIARDGRILVTGYNGPPAGMPHCNHPAEELGDGFSCKLAVHAEANAVAFAARHGVGTDGCEAILTHAPCHECAKLIINSGIRRVYYQREFRDMSGVDLLERARIETYCGP